MDHLIKPLCDSLSLRLNVYEAPPGEDNAVMGWDGMGWDGMGCDGMGWDGMRWDAMGCDVMRCDVM